MVKKQSNEKPQSSEHLLTVLDVAQILQISRSFVYELVAQGHLPAMHIGRSLRFRAGDVQRYISRRSEGRSSAAESAERKKQ
jgi:excisionase family DNA binding protein